MPIRLELTLACILIATSHAAMANDGEKALGDVGTQIPAHGTLQKLAPAAGLAATIAALSLTKPPVGDAETGATQTSKAQATAPQSGAGRAEPTTTPDTAPAGGLAAGDSAAGWGTGYAYWWIGVAEVTGATGTGHRGWMGSGSF